MIQKQTSQQILKNRLCIKASIDVIQWLTFQACSFRGHDERFESKNQANLFELLELLTSYNNEVKNAPQNTTYASPGIQKEILYVYARNAQRIIRDEIGASKFCLIINEAQDESKREQIAIIVRFVDKDGFAKERFLDLVHVKDTSTATLKKEISYTFNMHGEWNGLQGLFLKDCPHTYYMHCLAHQLQLTLVAAAREIVDRNDELQANQSAEIAHLISINELESGRGANQIGALQRLGYTRWGSYFNLICSLLKKYGVTCSILQNIAIKGSTYSQHGNATSAINFLMSFDFVFASHQKSQDILNAMHLMSSTKLLIQKLRDTGYKALLDIVTSICNRQQIQVPDMNASFSDIIRSRLDIFTVAIYHQLQELNNRFSEQAIELLIFSVALDPRDTFKSFKVDDIYSFVEKFYHQDFSDQEKLHLRFQLQHYELDVLNHPDLQNLSTMANLCRELNETMKSKAYPL
ncbi:hypothetical protein P3X46_033691, partial [Hevea brasiliensis]